VEPADLNFRVFNANTLKNEEVSSLHIISRVICAEGHIP